MLLSTPAVGVQELSHFRRDGGFPEQRPEGVAENSFKNSRIPLPRNSGRELERLRKEALEGGMHHLGPNCWAKNQFTIAVHHPSNSWSKQTYQPFLEGSPRLLGNPTMRGQCQKQVESVFKRMQMTMFFTPVAHSKKKGSQLSSAKTIPGSCDKKFCRSTGRRRRS